MIATRARVLFYESFMIKFKAKKVVFLLDLCIPVQKNNKGDENGRASGYNSFSAEISSKRAFSLSPVYDHASSNESNLQSSTIENDIILTVPSNVALLIGI